MRNAGPLVQIPANALMEMLGERLTLNLTVEELLWGYDEPLFKLIQPIITIPGFDQGKFGFLMSVSFDGSLILLGEVISDQENW